MRLFIPSPKDHGLSPPALQPGVCRYGTKLACCYGWRRNSKEVCEGSCGKTQTTLGSSRGPVSLGFYLGHHERSPDGPLLVTKSLNWLKRINSYLHVPYTLGAGVDCAGLYMVKGKNVSFFFFFKSNSTTFFLSLPQTPSL